ncbi:MAG: hypothetical protein ACK47M_08135, partial [Caldilinea sp.]
MTSEANTHFGKTQSGNARLHPIELHGKQDLFPLQSQEYIPTSPHSSNLISTNLDRATGAGYAAMRPVQSTHFGRIGVINQVLQSAADQMQRVLADQVTPLRLAGHLSVLMIATVVLVLSQVSIPEWDLSLESTPVAVTGSFAEAMMQNRY